MHVAWRPAILLVGIISLFFIFGLWNAGNQDLVGDESSYSFRSVGYLDYLGTSAQTQPVDWYNGQPLPWWTHLSFHDHPPLVFLIQHLFFSIFGDSIFVARLPSIFAGVVSILLLYLIIKKLFRSNALAFGAAFLFAVDGAMVWISRTALMEPIFLCLTLLNIFFFLQFLEQKKYFWLFGITLGLVLLTKYIGIFLLPLYAIYLLFSRKREVFKSWQTYAVLFLVIIVLSPVILYNVYLYKARGHFDLQIAYALGQKTPEWSGLLGKIQSPFSEISLNLKNTYGFPTLALAGFGFLSSVISFWKTRSREILFVWLYVGCLTLLLVVIGSAPRFLSLYGPAFAILGAFALVTLWRDAISRRGAVVVWIALILLFSLEKNFVEREDYGVAKLDHYFEAQFQGQESAVIPESENSHLNEVINSFAKKKSPESPRAFSMIVYDENIGISTLLWVIDRRFFYHSIPTLYVQNFRELLAKEGSAFFKPFTLYFVESTPDTILNPFKLEKTAGRDFEMELIKKDLKPDQVIYGHDQLPMFRIYKFTI